MSFPALSRKDFSILGEFVGGGEERFLKGHAFVADGQLVSPAQGAGGAVEERLCPDICETMRYEALSSVRREKSVKGLYVWVDSDLQERICAMIGGRVAKEVFATECVVLVVPLGARSSWGHVDGVLLYTLRSADSSAKV